MPQGPSSPLELESGQQGTPKLGSTVYRLSGHFYMKLLHDMILLSHWLSNFQSLTFPRDTLGLGELENRGVSQVSRTPSL